MAFSSNPPSSSTMKRLFSSAWSLICTRIEIASLELREEKARIFSAFFMGLLAVFFGVMACITLTGLLIFLFWKTYFWQVLSGLCASYMLIALICAVKACSRIHKAPLAFEATQDEFKKDIKSLNSSDE